ncbi:fungal specific transcription factor domain-containing protein [Aspergillus ibericus CBS 121593]|uniref:Xylanolytic transcriptional activator regulatory domain-containing protein n=1 Tax=Aspergillus ibericus CBS 121593 TaxID=1448316 RepID=A0A395HDY5_9EURO|nr:hypothetical protein BO80DRAFT_934 [Aspergillus ibericus CBS 121593]RAL06087.1 hypothetical protein BO80DRAFT_934 [Aspergillus ibericus CBS 121593]
METDRSTAPKRRRSALACEECRRRKIRSQSPPEAPSQNSPRIRAIAREPSHGSADTHGLSHPTPSVEALTDRIQQLEQKLSEALSLQAESRSQQLPTVAPEPTAINGTFSKTRFFGNSQRSICERKFRHLFVMFFLVDAPENAEIHALLEQTKRLARTAKAQIILHQPVCADLRELIPPRRVSDQLVQTYLRAMESVYRIVHIPSFLQAYELYWIDSAAAAPAFIIKILLIMAIGSVFCQDHTQDGLPISRAVVLRWVYTAQTWLSSPFEKSRLDLDTLQLHCLLLIARQINPVGSDLVWLAAGTLLRTAMHMGLHIDPRRIPNISLFDAELRRRLWATVLEINLQTSTDAGGLPLISTDDYDCEPPMNIDDEQMENPTAQPTEMFTHTSLQIALLRSLPVRLQIARFTNDFRRGVSYDEALRLSAELTAIYRDNSTLFQTFNKGVSKPTPFHSRLFDLMTQRFLLALHDPFTIRAKSNPTYYYSRQMSLQTSLQILSPFTSDAPDTAADPDYTSLLLIGAAVYRDVTAQAICVIADECLDMLDKRQTSLTALAHSFAHEPQLLALRAIVERSTAYCMKRVRAGETNIKGYLISSFLLAYIDARWKGEPVEGVVREAFRQDLKRCVGLLEELIERAGDSTSVPAGETETNVSFSPENIDWLANDELMPDLGADMDINAWLTMQGMV